MKMRKNRKNAENAKNVNVTINMGRNPQSREEMAGFHVPGRTFSGTVEGNPTADYEWGDLAYSIATEAADTLEAMLFEYFERKGELTVPLLILIHRDEDGCLTMNLFSKGSPGGENGGSEDGTEESGDLSIDIHRTVRKSEGKAGDAPGKGLGADSGRCAYAEPEGKAGDVPGKDQGADPGRCAGAESGEKAAEDPEKGYSDSGGEKTSEKDGRPSSVRMGGHLFSNDHFEDVRNMLGDMESLKGMIYGAMQMSSLVRAGTIDREQYGYTLQLYCKNAREVVDKWNAFWKDS